MFGSDGYRNGLCIWWIWRLSMNYRQHLGYGLLAILTTVITLVSLSHYTSLVDGWNIYGFFNITFREYEFAVPIMLFASIWGMYASILPDIDIGTSKAFMVTYLLLILIMVYYLVFTTYLLPIIISLIIMAFILGLKHRGIMHTVIAGVIIGVTFGWLFNNYLVILFIVIGYWTHLICDIRRSDNDNRESDPFAQ